MYVSSAQLTFYIPYSNSLKDKRQVRRSLIDKTKHKFNVSIAEVATQDFQQTLTLGLAVVSSEASHAEKSLEEIIRFMEQQTDANLIKVDM